MHWSWYRVSHTNYEESTIKTLEITLWVHIVYWSPLYNIGGLRNKWPYLHQHLLVFPQTNSLLLDVYVIFNVSSLKLLGLNYGFMVFILVCWFVLNRYLTHMQKNENENMVSDWRFKCNQHYTLFQSVMVYIVGHTMWMWREVTPCICSQYLP